MGLKLEALLISGVMVLIGITLWTIYHLAHTSAVTTDVVNTLLDHLHVLEGALIAWGTQIVTVLTNTMTSKMRASRVAKENGNDESRTDRSGDL